MVIVAQWTRPKVRRIPAAPARAEPAATTKRLGTQLCRFALVGASNTAVTLGTYAAALHTGVRYLPAGAAAYALGGANGFVLNRTWTFGHRGRALPAAARYAAVTAAGLVASLVVLHTAVAVGVPRAAAEAAAVPPVTLLTFALSRMWAFAPDVQPPASPAPAPGRPRGGRRGAARGRRLDAAGAPGEGG